MQQLIGKPVSPGYATGVAFIHGAGSGNSIPQYNIADGEVATEHQRFHDAIGKSYRELKRLEDKVLAELGEAQSAIFSAHLGLLQDQQFVQRVKDRISRDLVNVEQALDAEVADLSNMLATVENEYLRERAQDIRDVGNRVMRQLGSDSDGHYEKLPPESVIVARELLPSETIDLDRRHVAAIVTEEGGETSHAAILARALGIPAVTAVAGATSKIANGARLLVDGEKGVVTIQPTGSEEHDFAIQKTHYEQYEQAALAAEGLECVTKDGSRISLLANINRTEEVDSVVQHHLDGVGLFRTEFLFMDSPEPPSFERQAELYRGVLERLGERPLIIRTLDLGGDKLPSFLTPQYEANPALGRRGLQFSLAERKLLETQLRAIITASQEFDNVRVLLPMVLGEHDMAEAVKLAREIAAGLNVQKLPPIGAMIETPAALFALGEIFRLADFVCLGTNDLTQFMLATDRGAVDPGDDYSVLHPSVLRAIAGVVQAGRDAGREVCVCGEAAGFSRTAALLVGLGVRQLSMSPVRAARVRLRLRSCSVTQLEGLAGRALRCDSPICVRQLLLDEFTPPETRDAAQPAMMEAT